MAYKHADFAVTKSFRPKEPQVELFEAACRGNVIVSLINAPARNFICCKSTEHYVNYGAPGSLVLFLASSAAAVARQAANVRRLTCCEVAEVQELPAGLSSSTQVVVTTVGQALGMVEARVLCIPQISLVILHQCHRVVTDLTIQQFIELCNENLPRPRVLGLAGSLLPAVKAPFAVETEVALVEAALRCVLDTASDCVTVLQYGVSPKECLLECAEPQLPVSSSAADVLAQVEDEVASVLGFLQDHEFDVCEYDGFEEDMLSLPDPTAEPLRVLNNFLAALHTFGLYPADKAAYVILTQLESLKVRTPYERHYLLLCLVSTVFVKIRAMLQTFFESMTEKEKIYKYTCPKILRLFEVVRQFRDKSEDDSNQNILPPNDDKVEILPSGQEEAYTEQMAVHSGSQNNGFTHFVCSSEPSTSEPRNGDAIDIDVTSQSPGRATEECQGSGFENNNSETSAENVEEVQNGNQFLVLNYVCSSQGESNSKSEVLPKENNMPINFKSQALPKENVPSLAPIETDSEQPTDGFRRVADNTRLGKASSDWPRGPRVYLLDRKKPIKIREWDPDALCGLILVDDEFTARLLFSLFSDLRSADSDFSFLRPHFTVALSENIVEESVLERTYRKQETVLMNFRMRECNLLIGTAFLESDIDLPRCNLVVRFDIPRDYRSYAQGKARARGPDALHCLLAVRDQREQQQAQLACFHAVDQMLMKKGRNPALRYDQDCEADRYECLVKAFCPAVTAGAPHVTLSSAIALLNRYCARLPSDTFTHLTPLWNLVTWATPDGELHICTIRLPINSVVKKAVTGPAMVTAALACRFAALQACLNLQASRELDDSLLPLTKETFWQREKKLVCNAAEDLEEQAITNAGVDARPGSHKRRQYYDKRTAKSLTECRPVPGEPCFLYHIAMLLTCPLPEELNTRGRKILAPEDSPRGFGILTARHIPAVGAFPIFTRVGEVAVELALASDAVTLTPCQIEKIVAFINFTFTSVLHLQKYLVTFDPDASENSYFIVPTVRGLDTGVVSVDWEFLDLIFETRNQVTQFIPDSDRANVKFEPSRYSDAVVFPWYRNQDQPECFYVSEICSYLTPKSAFPGTDYGTFEEYYLNKYGVQVQNTEQPLLDVDHTSARLNFLTPRYVNRKGVALPTTSAAKRARRENLSQKQILVPELCNVHPFSGSLWQKAACLPSILYRLNSLLLADEVRRLVACDLGLGHPGDPDVEWPPLDFGWKLSDVLSKSRQAAAEKLKQEEAAPRGRDSIHSVDSALTDSCKTPWVEVGTWSNELVEQTPSSIVMLSGAPDSDMGWESQPLRYGSPTSWLRDAASGDELYDSSSEMSDSDSESEMLDDSGNDPDRSEDLGGLRIEFKGKDVAEAVETNRRLPSLGDISDDAGEVWECNSSSDIPLFEENKKKFEQSLREYVARIETDGVLCTVDEPFTLPWDLHQPSPSDTPTLPTLVPEKFGTSNNIVPELADDFDTLAKDLPHAMFIRQSLLKYQVIMEIKQRAEKTSEVTCHCEDEIHYKELSDDRKDVEAENAGQVFSFDHQPVLAGHSGPSPSLILQALTMSSANDGVNLERLETIGDSFLKFAITNFLYCNCENVHEGKLSYLRSKLVSNLSLYRLGRQKVFAEWMVATKFEPHDNWLPPCYFVPRELERALIQAGLPASRWNRIDLPALHSMGREDVARLVKERSEQLGLSGVGGNTETMFDLNGVPTFIPYNLITQQSISDKSVADCVEALIGAYLVACGTRGALLFMSWLGIKVLPRETVYGVTCEELLKNREAGHTAPLPTGLPGDLAWCQTRFGELLPPKPPLLRNIAEPEGELARLLTGFDAFEGELQYRFRDRSYLLQAVTHASYSVNQLTDCYQRLEFLGDAVLDYLITRHLFEDFRDHSPGSLTDFRSALVNNRIFASLAVRHGYHRFFRHLSPALHDVVDRFVRIQEENNHAICDECYLVEEEEDSEAAEDVEVPKALGDVFESVAGAIFLDSAMSLDAVWRVYYRIMKPEIDAFSTSIPKSPIRVLLEMEPDNAHFGIPEKLADGRRVRVAVEIVGKGVFKGIGRNYRIAKCTAAKCALTQLKRRGLLQRNKQQPVETVP